jgi:hypothetical protein
MGIHGEASGEARKAYENAIRSIFEDDGSPEDDGGSPDSGD